MSAPVDYDGLWIYNVITRASPGGTVVRNLPPNAGDVGLIPGLGRSPGVGNGDPLQYSCLENPMDGADLAGYSPWGRKESNMIKHTHTHTHTHKM